MNCLSAAFRTSLAACMTVLAGMATAPALAQDVVTVGHLRIAPHIALYVADDRGFFADENITIQYEQFNSAANMVPPLGVGQLDIGVGAISAGLYNAVGRGVDIKVVADMTRFTDEYGSQILMVRKQLHDSGEVSSIADLKGRKLSMTSEAAIESSAINEALKSVGLTFDDIERVQLGQPQQAAAYENGAIDAAIASEPNATILARSGLAVELAGVWEFYPNSHSGVVLFGDNFATRRKDVADRFMRAYIRGIRYYNDALEDGRLAGEKGEEVARILVERTAIDDIELARGMRQIGVHPDGELRRESLENDLEFFRSRGLIEDELSLDDIIDTSFTQAAVAELGPYVREE